METAAYVYDAVIAVLHYEETHDKGHDCLQVTLDVFPEQIVREAKAIRSYLLQKERTDIMSSLARGI